MTTRPLTAVFLGVALLCTACSGAELPTEARGSERPELKSGTDAGAMTDLQGSDHWTQPRCRWIETGAHLLAWPQDTAVMTAARDLGYVEMEQVGTGNRIGTVEPAWRVAVTAAGRVEAAKCASGSSRSNVFGMPVSQRRYLMGKRIKGPDMYNPDQTTFEVEFEWVPTGVGDVVKHVLTDKMRVEQGLATARVTMRYGDRTAGRGSNGWAVQSIADGK